MSKTMIGKILWIDNRDLKHFEGQILGDNDMKYYFNYSVSKSSMNKNQLVKFEVDSDGFPYNVRDFLASNIG